MPFLLLDWEACDNEFQVPEVPESYSSPVAHQATMNLLYFSALLFAALRSPYTGISQRFPGFHVFLCLQAICASIWIFWPDSDALTTKYGWAPIEASSILAAVSAGAEIIAAVERAGACRDQLHQTAAVILGVAVGLWLGGTTPYRLFLTVREATWIWLFLASAAALLDSWLRAVTLDPMLRRHAVLFTLLMGGHAFIAPILTWGGMPTWISAQWIYRLAAVACCVGWATTDSRDAFQYDPGAQRAARSAAA